MLHHKLLSRDSRAETNFRLVSSSLQVTAGGAWQLQTTAALTVKSCVLHSFPFWCFRLCVCDRSSSALLHSLSQQDHPSSSRAQRGLSRSLGSRQGGSWGVYVYARALYFHAVSAPPLVSWLCGHLLSRSTSHILWAARDQSSEMQRQW